MVAKISKRASEPDQALHRAAADLRRLRCPEADRRRVLTARCGCKCGGYIVIDETEALIAIDVNTGRNKGGRDQEKTILQDEPRSGGRDCRQMRLRNIGGIDRRAISST